MNKIIVIAILSLLAISLFAHPASDVKMKYDAKAKLLTVDFKHSVKSATDHYIDKVSIILDGKEVITQVLSQQDSKTGGSLVYKLSGIKAGSEVEAITNCNKTGKKSAKLNFKK